MENQYQFIQRMQEEKDDLSNKIDKLQLFLKTETFVNLPRQERQLLQEQYTSMIGYLTKLTIRLDIYKERLFFVQEGLSK